jgi:hypothetical protein
MGSPNINAEKKTAKYFAVPSPPQSASVSFWTYQTLFARSVPNTLDAQVGHNVQKTNLLLTIRERKVLVIP